MRYIPAVALLLLWGCERAPPPADPGAVSRPVEILEVQASMLDGNLRFPGRVRAAQRAELTFNIAGRLVEFPVKEGDRLAKGALVAKLDPANFELRASSARAEFEQAQTNYERVRTVWEQTQAVPRAEVDQKRTALEVARSTYAAARKDLEDTGLRAPFEGVVARRYVDNFQNVQAREPIISLQDLAELEIVIHVPERIVRTEPRRVAGYAVLDGGPEERFSVSLKSFSADADPQTQTYEVVLGFTRPDGLVVLPGAAVTIFPDGAGDVSAAAPVRIPIKAIITRGDGGTYAWVVDPASSRVSLRAVDLGAVNGGEVLVLRGLEPGERIVTAGVHQLHEGMWVRPL